MKLLPYKLKKVLHIRRRIEEAREKRFRENLPLFAAQYTEIQTNPLTKIIAKGVDIIQFNEQIIDNWTTYYNERDAAVQDMLAIVKPYPYIGTVIATCIRGYESICRKTETISDGNAGMALAYRQ